MIILVAVYFCEWLWCLSNLVMKPRMLSYHRGFRREIRCGKLDDKAYRKWKKFFFTIKSNYGYRVSCEHIENSDQPLGAKVEVEGGQPTGRKRIAILCHGLGYARYSCIKYVELYLKLGFIVVIYDHRNHGLSGRACTSMGYYERYDLKSVVDWCRKRYPDCQIITHGESMGAATVIMHLGIDERVSCAIADSAYSDLTKLLRHQLKQYYHLPSFMISLVSSLTYLRAGFYYREVSPAMVVRRTDTPILFIHGKIDNLVPAAMSKEMYRIKARNKAIYLVAGARHVQSCCQNREGYEKVIEQYLRKYLKD